MRTQGFTLLELMIVIVVVGYIGKHRLPFLSSIGIKITTARMLWRPISKSSHNRTLLCANVYLQRCMCALPAFPQTSPQGFYTITLTNRTATTYTFTATATGTQALDTTCATMSIDQANQKTATTATCWTQYKNPGKLEERQPGLT